MWASSGLISLDSWEGLAGQVDRPSEWGPQYWSSLMGLEAKIEPPVRTGKNEASIEGCPLGIQLPTDWPGPYPLPRGCFWFISTHACLGTKYLTLLFWLQLPLVQMQRVIRKEHTQYVQFYVASQHLFLMQNNTRQRGKGCLETCLMKGLWGDEVLVCEASPVSSCTLIGMKKAHGQTIWWCVFFTDENWRDPHRHWAERAVAQHGVHSHSVCYVWRRSQWPCYGTGNHTWVAPPSGWSAAMRARASVGTLS